MTEMSKDDMQKAIALVRKFVKGKVRVLFLARLLEATLENTDGFADETEVAAAIKSLLVKRTSGFSVAQKAATEALMSRDVLRSDIGLQEAYQAALRDSL